MGHPHNRFELGELEQRVLLSADGLFAGAPVDENVSIDSAQGETPAIVISISDEQGADSANGNSSGDLE